VHPEPIAVPGGLVLLQLKEKTLAARDEFTPAKSEILRKLEIAKRSDALVRYVARLRHPEDRRKHNVAITEKGVAALERAEGELRRLEDEVLAGLSVDERTQLRRLLAKALESP